MVSNPIREWRRKHGLSYRHAAELLGVSEMTVWRWEHGRKVPKAVEIAIEHLDERMCTADRRYAFVWRDGDVRHRQRGGER